MQLQEHQIGFYERHSIRRASCVATRRLWLAAPPDREILFAGPICVFAGSPRRKIILSDIIALFQTDPTFRLRGARKATCYVVQWSVHSFGGLLVRVI